jgi:arsenate reductase
MTPRAWNVLFLCTGNSARSILAEALLRDMGEGRFRAFSAGSHPAGEVHPLALDYLRKRGIDAGGLSSKSWQAFARADMPKMDFVITVCDNAAGEVCPIWPGQPMTAHWGLPDPAEAAGTEAEVALAFAETYRMLRQRISAFAALPIVSLDQLALKRRMDEIGRGAESLAGASAS